MREAPERPHVHVYERVTHFEWAFCEAHPTEKEAEEALERFAREQGAEDIEHFTDSLSGVARADGSPRCSPCRSWARRR